MLRRTYKSVLVFFLLLSLFATMVPSAFAGKAEELQDEINRLEAEADQLAAEKEALGAELSETNTKAQTYAEEKQRIDREIELCLRERDLLNEQIHRYNQLIAEKQAELDELEAKQAKQTERYQLRMRTMQESGEISVWTVLLTSESFADMLSRRVMVEEIARADQKMLQELRETSVEILHAKNELAEKKAMLEKKKQELATLETELGEKRARADEMLADLSADKQRLLEEITRVDAMEADLIAQIAQRQAELNDLPKDPDNPMPPTESGFLFPVDPSGFVYLSSPYGFRIHPITGIYTMHTGVDLASYQGTPVYASKSGEIDIAVYGYALGNYVVIDHGDGFSTLYAHMTHFVVSKGDYVTQGQVIGYVGSTGAYSNGPHLHFTVMYDGKTVNPMSYISLP